MARNRDSSLSSPAPIFFRSSLQHGFLRADKVGVSGKLHQGTLELFRDDPWLAFDLLGIERPVAGIPIDRRAEVERDKPDQQGVVESSYPDLVMVHKDSRGAGIVICVEAQGKLAYKKRWMLP